MDLTPEVIQNILRRSKEYSEYDHETKTTNFRIVKDNLHFGSYESSIILKCFESEEAYIEFSIPKQYLGNNVELVYPSSLEQALAGVHGSLVDRFGAFPSYRNWRLQRLDLCYGWKYSSQASAAAILNVLKTFDYPRKNKYLYQESVMWRGKTSSIKFYLKYPEFIRHDYKKLVQLGKDEYADKILKLSEGVLRFEITFRKPAIDTLFGRRTVYYSSLLDLDFLETALDLKLGQLTMNLDKSVIDDNEALRRLKLIYPSQKAIRLLNFYILYNSTNINHRRMIRENYTYTTIWRYKSDIAKAKLGLPNFKSPVEFKLDIPSDLVVNTDPNRSSES